MCDLIPIKSVRQTFYSIIGVMLTLSMDKVSFAIGVTRIVQLFSLLERIRTLKLKQVLPLPQVN